MSTTRRRTDNLVLLHANVAALAFPGTTGTPTPERARAPDGSGPRFVEIRVIGKAAGPMGIPGPVYLIGNEDLVASQGGAAADEWNQIGAALNAGAAITVTNKHGYSEVRELVAGYRSLALYNSGGAITGGNIDVQLIPLDADYH